MLGDDTSSLGRAIDRSENFSAWRTYSGTVICLHYQYSLSKIYKAAYKLCSHFENFGNENPTYQIFMFLIFFYTTVLTLIFGLFFGWLLQNNFINLMSAYFPTELPSPGLHPLLVTCLTAFISIRFYIPSYLKALSISPCEV